jgi:segregation and condensation protein B
MIDQSPSTEHAKAEVPAVRSTQDVSGELEALLLLAEEPISEDALAEVIDVPRSMIEDCLAELVAFYQETGRGFELRQLGGGWRYYTREEHANVVARYALAPQQSKLSQAALETLAVVAYSQPISRGRIAGIRGVNVDGVIRTLVARGLITEAGHDTESGAVVFATTPYFLERMGLRSLDELPELAPHLPEVSELEDELRQYASPAPESADSSPEPLDEQAERASTPTTSESGYD